MGLKVRKPVLPYGKTGFLGGRGKPLENLEGFLESLARGQANALGSLDLDLLAGLGVDAGTGLAVHDLEGSETDQLEALVLLDEALDVLNDGVDDLFGVGLGDILAEGLLDGFNEMEFAAHGLLCWVGFVVV
jgi:hypothetical protein